VVVPCDVPVATPEADPIVATDVLLLVHVPPADELERVVVEPLHTDSVPLIEPGVA